MLILFFGVPLMFFAIYIMNYRRKFANAVQLSREQCEAGMLKLFNRAPTPEEYAAYRHGATVSVSDEAFAATFRERDQR
jgi:hypothetical protein